MTVDVVACPTCDGTGGGSGFRDECGDCLGSGEVTRTRRTTLQRIRSAMPTPKLIEPKRAGSNTERRPAPASKPVAEAPVGVETWPRKSVPTLLPWLTYRQIDSWFRLGVWVPQFQPAGAGHRSLVALSDLEGLGLIGRLVGHLGLGSYAPNAKLMPPWPEIRRACKTGGVWLAADRSWEPWQPGVDPVPVLGVVVDVGAVMADVHNRVGR